MALQTFTVPAGQARYLSAPSSQWLLQAEGLTKRYGSTLAVDHVDFSVAPAEVVAIIGPNGAGKSTLVELLLGLRDPDAGSVRYRDPQLRRRMGVQLQTTPFFIGLSVADNLNIFAAFYGVRLTQARTREILEQCGLADAARRDAARLSGGQKKRLAIALTLVHEPQVVFLDEPTAALDPRAQHEVRLLMRDLSRRGTAVVFTSHDMTEVQELADRVVLISGGRVLASGTPEQLLAHHRVASLEDLYLLLTQGG